MNIKHKKSGFRKAVSGFILLTFLTWQIFTPAIVQAQALPLPGTSIGLTAGFQPPVLLGLKIHPENPLLFDFIVDQGASQLSQDELKSETEKLVKYFLAALTIPDKEVWVNLSPYEKDRIIPDVLGQTTMGKTMLEQDYMLKQLASSLTNPDEEMGQEFWNKVKTETQKQLGTTDVPMNTFNKVWIVPQKAEVLESQGIVLVGEKRLKLMMDQDYVAMEKNSQSQNDKAKNVSTISSNIFKDTILPNIEKEINEGRNFANVRQIYNSVILAAWYKKALKESLLGKVYADKGKVVGVETDDKEMKQRIYEQYLAAFKKGVYNVIKEEQNATGDLIPRKYFSGGIAGFGAVGSSALTERAITLDQAAIQIAGSSAFVAQVYAATEKSDLVAVKGKVAANDERFASSSSIVMDYRVRMADIKIQLQYSNIQNSDFNKKHGQFITFGHRTNGPLHIILGSGSNQRTYILSHLTAFALDSDSGRIYFSHLNSSDQPVLGYLDVAAALALEQNIRHEISITDLPEAISKQFVNPEVPAFLKNPHTHLRVYNERVVSPSVYSRVPEWALSFKEYMDQILHNPQFGYYATGRVRFGPDFLTYPEVLSPLFGRMVAEQAIKMWQGMLSAGTLASDENFYIVEFGAGNGVLARDFLNYVIQKSTTTAEDNNGSNGSIEDWKRFRQQMKYRIYERSAGLRVKQRAELANFADMIDILDGDATNPSKTIAIKSIKGLIFSNELPDAFAVQKVILNRDTGAEVAFALPVISRSTLENLSELGLPKEIADAIENDDANIRKELGLESSRKFISKRTFEVLMNFVSSLDEEVYRNFVIHDIRFTEVYIPAYLVPEVAEHIQENIQDYAMGLSTRSDEFISYINVDSERFIEGAGKVLRAGYVITIDYGDSLQKLIESGSAPRAQTLRVYSEGNDALENDPFQHPTLQDVTSDVNFSALASKGNQVGLKSLYFGAQRHLMQGTPWAIFLEHPDSFPTFSESELAGFELHKFFKERFKSFRNIDDVRGFNILVQQMEGTDSSYGAFAKLQSQPLMSPKTDSYEPDVEKILRESLVGRVAVIPSGEIAASSTLTPAAQESIVNLAMSVKQEEIDQSMPESERISGAITPDNVLAILNQMYEKGPKGYGYKVFIPKDGANDYGLTRLQTAVFIRVATRLWKFTETSYAGKEGFGLVSNKSQFSPLTSFEDFKGMLLGRENFLTVNIESLRSPPPVFQVSGVVTPAPKGDYTKGPVQYVSAVSAESLMQRPSLTVEQAEATLERLKELPRFMTDIRVLEIRNNAIHVEAGKDGEEPNVFDILLDDVIAFTSQPRAENGKMYILTKAGGIPHILNLNPAFKETYTQELPNDQNFSAGNIPLRGSIGLELGLYEAAPAQTVWEPGQLESLVSINGQIVYPEEREQMIADDEYVRSVGLTHQQLALALKFPEYFLGGRVGLFFTTHRSTRDQSAFDPKLLTNLSGDLVDENGRSLMSVSGITAEKIGRFGDYGAIGSKYRVDPRLIVRIFFPNAAASSGVNNGKAASAPISGEASGAATSSSAAVGGIDFDPTNMNLQIKRDGKGVPLPLPQQNLEQINIQGLFPIIINIVPVNAQTLPIFLGQAPKEPAREPELAASSAG